MSTPQEPDGAAQAPEPDVAPLPRQSFQSFQQPHQPHQPCRVPGWSRRARWVTGSVAILGLTASLAVGGATWAGASSTTPVVTPVESPSAAPEPPEGKPVPGHWSGGWFGGPAGALHGQFVVPKSGGGYETVEMQRGEVTSVSADALAVRSEDGYTKNYVINADTLVNGGRDGIASIEKSDEVAVMATGGGERPAAVSVVDLTERRNFHERWGWPWRGHRPAD